jgi:hypothetical protein
MNMIVMMILTIRNKFIADIMLLLLLLKHDDNDATSRLPHHHHRDARENARDAHACVSQQSCDA